MILAMVLLTVGQIAADSTVNSRDFERFRTAADSLYAIGEFDAAALEYKRSIYYSRNIPLFYPASAGPEITGEEPVGYPVFDPDEDSLLTQVKLAMTLYRNGETSEADSILYGMDNPLVRMVRAVILIQEDNPFLAAMALDSATRETFGKRAHRLRGWAYTQANDFWNAAGEFEKAGDDSLGTLVGQLSGLRLKNPRTARLLSILPGLGEAYAGRPLFGLWSLMVNTGDTYLIVTAILQKHYLDAFLVYTFLWQRFYSGSMANADKFAREYNERKLSQAIDPIKEDFGYDADLSLELAALDELYRIYIRD